MKSYSCTVKGKSEVRRLGLADGESKGNLAGLTPSHEAAVLRMDSKGQTNHSEAIAGEIDRTAENRRPQSKQRKGQRPKQWLKPKTFINARHQCLCSEFSAD